MELSKRATAIAESMTLAIDAKAKKMHSQGIAVIGFGAGEPDFDTPVYIRDAAKEALDAGYTRYTPAAGTLALRQAICDKLERDNGLTMSLNRLSYLTAQSILSIIPLPRCSIQGMR